VTQRYSDITALRRMKDGLCPECGQQPKVHAGWAAIGCSLGVRAVLERIHESKQPAEHIVDPADREHTFCGKTARFHRATSDLDATVKCRECRKGTDDLAAAEDATWD
jgi:rubredoxin